MQRSMTFASPGMCSQIETPGADVAIGRNSPRISSGASGFRSHMSIVAGPPASQIWITPVAGFLVRGSGGAQGLGPQRVGQAHSQAARPRRPAGRRGDGTPRSRSVFETSRCPPNDRRARFNGSAQIRAY